jgi:hypothetical protein
MNRIAALALLPVLLSGPALAAQGVSLHANTAGELADMCGANPKDAGADARINYCHGYAQGTLDAVRRRAEEAKKFCFPQSPPTRTVVMGEFVNWVRALPDHRTQPAATGLINFFADRFPCGK